MSDIHIPPEALEAARRAYEMRARSLDRDPLTAAIRAALKAWPGMVRNYSWDGSHGRIILPLNTEPTDEPR